MEKIRHCTAQNGRRSPKQQHQALTQQVGRLHIFEENIKTAGRQWDQILLGESSFVAAYRKEPALLKTVSQWAAYAKELELAGQLLATSTPDVQQTWKKTRDIIEENVRKNPLTVGINGTTLDDIAQMPLPLSVPDIKRIDLMIGGRARTDKRGVNPQFDVQNIISMAAIQAELNPRFPLSDEARLLIERLKNYWEYYTGWALNPNRSIYPGQFVVKMIQGAYSGGYLPWALLAFMPARLHISTLSTYRLFDTHIENMDSRICQYLFRRGFFLRHASDLLNSIASTRELPQSVLEYQLVTPQSESALAKRLKQEYSERAVRTQAVAAVETESTQAIIKKLASLYHRDLRGIIQSSKDPLLRIPVPTDSFFKEILAGVFHGKTLTIIGLNAEKQIQVCLDLVQNGRLFGVPPQLARRNPLLTNLMIQDLLRPVLEEARSRYPLAEFTPTNGFVVSAIPVSQGPAVTKEVPQPSKRRALRAITSSFTDRHKMPENSTASLPQEKEDQHLLIYKGQAVEDQDITLVAQKIASDLIPNDPRLGSDIELILKSLLEDPYGPGTYKVEGVQPATENAQRMPIRSFRADVRKLPFNNKKYSSLLRTVYYINPKTRLVVLLGVMSHGMFDVQYTTGNH